jgi:hypothetical protein
MVRTAMLEELNQDYIRTARAKGLTENAVVYRHALAQRAHPGPHRHRPPVRQPARRRHRHRNNLQLARHRPAHALRHLQPRLRAGPGLHPRRRPNLRCSQSPHRRRLHCSQPPHAPEVSTFRFDARTATRATQLRAVATITFNPHPYSTFSGALFYFSVTPRATPAQCTAQAGPKPSAQASAQPVRTTTTQIGGIPFTHGYDEHGVICTEARDEIYTTSRNNACYRFDLVINTFCGGDVSGVQDISPRELDSVRHRMQTILDSVHFDTP